MAAQSVCSQEVSGHPLVGVMGSALGGYRGSARDPSVVPAMGSHAAAETTLIVLFLSPPFLLKVLSTLFGAWSCVEHGCARACPSPQYQFLTAREDGDFRPLSQTRRPIIQTIWVCMGPFELGGNHRWRIPVVPEAFSVK